MPCDALQEASLPSGPRDASCAGTVARRSGRTGPDGAVVLGAVRFGRLWKEENGPITDATNGRSSAEVSMDMARKPCRGVEIAIHIDANRARLGAKTRRLDARLIRFFTRGQRNHLFGCDKQCVIAKAVDLLVE